MSTFVFLKTKYSLTIWNKGLFLIYVQWYNKVCTIYRQNFKISFRNNNNYCKLYNMEKNVSSVLLKIKIMKTSLLKK